MKRNQSSEITRLHLGHANFMLKEPYSHISPTETPLSSENPTKEPHLLKGTQNYQLGTKKNKEIERDYAGSRTRSEQLALEDPRSDVVASKHHNEEGREWLLPLLMPTWKLKPEKETKVRDSSSSIEIYPQFYWLGFFFFFFSPL